MAKLTKKKTTAANNRKRSASPTTRKTVKKKSAADRVADEGDKLSFNHAMVYAKDVQRSLSFYTTYWDSSWWTSSATKASLYMRVCAHLAATAQSHCTRLGRGRRWPAMECGCTSRFARSGLLP
ncbi:MAG: hypothetical protein JO187_01250 [Acidobacteria bacterium]|nr:hypothetical protein [Acidobacteriota bacterium]